MVTTLDDTKRLAIGEKLADMRAIQNLIISAEQKLMSASPDQDVRDRLQNMLEDDQKNLGVLETVIVQYWTLDKEVITSRLASANTRFNSLVFLCSQLENAALALFNQNCQVGFHFLCRNINQVSC